MGKPRLSLVAGCVLVLALAALGGCDRPTVTARHSPHYDAQPHTSQIKVNATAKDGVKQVVVDVFVGDLVVCGNNLLSSMMPCRANTVQYQATCDYADMPAEADCNVDQPLQNLTLVTYRARVTSMLGRTASTRYITYSGGAPLAETAARVAPPGGPGELDEFEQIVNPIGTPSPNEVLHPIWLESSTEPLIYATPRKITFDGPGRLDVAYFPDADYNVENGLLGFSTDVNQLVNRTYFSPQYGYSQDYTQWRHMFSLWAAPFGATARTGVNCGARFSAWADIAQAAAIDARMVVHKAPFQDCASNHNAPYNWGTVGFMYPVQTAARTFVHETGHALVGLADEHCNGDLVGCVGGGKKAYSAPKNVFPSDEECQAAATALGGAYATNADALCVAMGTSGYWRIDDGSREIMEDIGNEADWQDSSRAALNKLLARCIQGQCY